MFLLAEAIFRHSNKDRSGDRHKDKGKDRHKDTEHRRIWKKAYMKKYRSKNHAHLRASGMAYWHQKQGYRGIRSIIAYSFNVSIGNRIGLRLRLASHTEEEE